MRHSSAELEWLAGVLLALEGRADVEAVLAAARRGDAFFLSDGVVDGRVFEYDEAHYHSDMERDERKMRRLVDGGATRIVRLPVAAPHARRIEGL